MQRFYVSEVLRTRDFGQAWKELWTSIYYSGKEQAFVNHQGIQLPNVYEDKGVALLPVLSMIKSIFMKVRIFKRNCLSISSDLGLRQARIQG